MYPCLFSFKGSCSVYIKNIYKGIRCGMFTSQILDVLFQKWSTHIWTKPTWEMSALSQDIGSPTWKCLVVCTQYSVDQEAHLSIGQNDENCRCYLCSGKSGSKILWQRVCMSYSSYLAAIFISPCPYPFLFRQSTKPQTMQPIRLPPPSLRKRANGWCSLYRHQTFPSPFFSLFTNEQR